MRSASERPGVTWRDPLCPEPPAQNPSRHPRTRRSTAAALSGRSPGLANPGRAQGTRGCPNVNRPERGGPPRRASPCSSLAASGLAAQHSPDACRVGDQLLLLVVRNLLRRLQLLHLLDELV